MSEVATTSYPPLPQGLRGKEEGISKAGKYIYGVINSDKELSFASCKVIAGIDVHTITYQDISAVVSGEEIIDYNQLLKETAARYLVRHQMVIEKVMENFTIIPVRLGTYASNEGEVRHILGRGYQIIKNIFEKIGGKIEVDVVATWGNFDAVLKEVAEDKEIKDLKQTLVNKKEGMTVNDQTNIGFLIKKHLDKRRDRYASEIKTSLIKISQQHKAHALMDDRMILNAAFLIERYGLKDFEKMVEELNNRYAERLNFRCIGPLPPYSFNTLEVKKIGFAEISSAKERLALGDTLTEEGLKKAYRHKATLYHPDKNSGRPDSEKQFAHLTRDYKMLLECWNSGVYSFREGEFSRDAIIVKVKD